MSKIQTVVEFEDRDIRKLIVAHAKVEHSAIQVDMWHEPSIGAKAYVCPLYSEGDIKNLIAAEAKRLTKLNYSGNTIKIELSVDTSSDPATYSARAFITQPGGAKD